MFDLRDAGRRRGRGAEDKLEGSGVDTLDQRRLYMKRYTFLCGAVLFLLLLTAPPTLAAPTGACYITPTGISIADALANPYCLIINLAAGTY